MSHSHIAHDALLSLLRALRNEHYAFVTPTPATHARVMARADRKEARDLRDIFGWSLPFAPGLLPQPMLAALERAEMVERRGDRLTSSVRISSVDGSLFLHSAYPTEHRDSVFLGPDTYRFADFIESHLDGVPSRPRIVDIGTGAGVGAVVAGRRRPDAELTLTDINADALFLASVNATHARLPVTTLKTSGLDGLDGPFDLIIANPPFIIDQGERAYRHGGDMHGARLSLDWAAAAASRLAPGGRLLLYTGSAIVGGEDALRTALQILSHATGNLLSYREIDPDIFGEELDSPAYDAVERIAAVGVVLTRPA